MSKRKGRHPQNELTSLSIRSTKTPGRYADGNGLYLVVDPTGAKRFILRTVIQGRRADLGLGSAALVGLSDARDKAREMRRVARSGGNPKPSQPALIESLTFEIATRRVYDEQRAAWRNEKHAKQWIGTLETYVHPSIGNLELNQISALHICRVLQPIWLKKPETARRVRQRMATIFDWAKALGYVTGENPVNGVKKALPRQTEGQSHHAALDYVDAPDFFNKLSGMTTTYSSATALQFLILTAARTGEVLGATWQEIDFERKLWTIPSTRMKSKREHKVPLSQTSLAILRSLRAACSGNDFVFSGRQNHCPLSNMVFNMMLRRMDLSKKTTAHGFRSTFKDWASDKTGFSNEVSEMALAHTVRNKTEAAYRRGNSFDKRRHLMDAWDNYLTRSERKVVMLRAS